MMDNIIKRIVLILVITAVSLLITAQLLKPQIASYIFSHALEQNLGRDISSDLPDGVHVLICGAGGAFEESRKKESSSNGPTIKASPLVLRASKKDFFLRGPATPS